MEEREGEMMERCGKADAAEEAAAWEGEGMGWWR